MALKIHSVQHLTASVSGSDKQIDLPPYTTNTSAMTDVTFVFDDSHTADIELCDTSGSTEGLQIKANTQYQSGPWKLSSENIPTYLYAASPVDCRVTVILSVN